MLEKQRNAEAEKVQLLQEEVQELRVAHQQVRQYFNLIHGNRL